MSLLKRASIAVALAVVLVAAGVGVARLAEGTGGCGPKWFTLNVSAAKAIAPALSDAANEWEQSDPTRINGECVQVVVTAADPVDTANQLLSEASAGATLPKGITPTAPPPMPAPAVWIPDSSVWLDEVSALVSSEFSGDAPSLASSPVVLGVRASQAAALKLTGGAISDDALRQALGTTRAAAAAQQAAPFELGVADPRYDAAGLAGATKLTMIEPTNGALGKYGAIVPDYRNAGLEGERATDPDNIIAAYTKKNPLVAGAPQMTVGFLSEQSIIAYDQQSPADPIQAVRAQNVGALDYPLAVLADLAPDQAQAAAAFVQAIRSDVYTSFFAAAGFRKPDGTTATGFTAVHGVSAAAAPITPLRLGGTLGGPITMSLGLWNAANSSANVSVLLDVNSSMTKVSSNGSDSRLLLMEEAAAGGVKLFTGDSYMSLSEWGNGVGTGNVRNLVPSAQLSTDQQMALVNEAGNTAVRSTGSGCGLYKAVKTAYTDMTAHYKPGDLNPLVIFTDCAADEPGLTLENLTSYLSGTVNASKPVPVILIDIAPSSVNISDQLSRIAAAAGGDALTLTRPTDILTVFITAVVTIDQHS